jgi:8-oxo-dGTP diphosphatase
VGLLGGYGKVTAAALAIVPGPNATITFLRQQRGPYAGHWLLPGGRVEFGESLMDAARRETLEESGCVVHELVPTGVYEIRGDWAEGTYHLIMFAFRSPTPTRVPAGFSGDHVGEVVQADPATLRPHPTVLRILNDAGVTSYDDAEIEAGLAAGGIALGCLTTGASLRFG